jgi:ThiF family
MGIPRRAARHFAPDDLTRDGVRIPYLDSSRQVCTFDDTTRFPNPELAGEAVIEVIERAVKIIRDGLAGANAADYWDEFAAYWVDGAKNPTRVLSIVRPEPPHRRIMLSTLSPQLGNASLLFAEDEAAAFDFLAALDRLPQKPRSRPALYLHLHTLGDPPDLRVNADVKRRLPPDAYEALLAFLKKTNRPCPVLFSVPVGATRVMGGWVHQQYAMEMRRGTKSRRVIGQAAGFRPGHLPPDVELTSAFGNQPIDRIVVTRADAKRLIARTRAETNNGIGVVNVIGCGSVGGFLALALAHGRPSPLRLVDNETLEVHNVPRHVCDLTFVGPNKADAVRSLLRRSDPHLLVEPLPYDIRDVLRTNPAKLQPAHLSVVAVANIAIERRLNAAARSMQLGTLAIVWIEPHAIAGHAIIVPPHARGCFECLVLPNGRVDVAVLQNPETFTIIDAGCRGSFVPYGGLDFEIFTNTIAREILTASERGESAVITWIGNVDEVRRNGWPVEEPWQSVESFSVHRRVLTARTDCPICTPA